MNLLKADLSRIRYDSDKEQYEIRGRQKDFFGFWRRWIGVEIKRNDLETSLSYDEFSAIMMKNISINFDVDSVEDLLMQTYTKTYMYSQKNALQKDESFKVSAEKILLSVSMEIKGLLIQPALEQIDKAIKDFEDYKSFCTEKYIRSTFDFDGFDAIIEKGKSDLLSIKKELEIQKTHLQILDVKQTKIWADLIERASNCITESQKNLVEHNKSLETNLQDTMQKSLDMMNHTAQTINNRYTAGSLRSAWSSFSSNREKKRFVSTYSTELQEMREILDDKILGPRLMANIVMNALSDYGQVHALNDEQSRWNPQSKLFNIDEVILELSHPPHTQTQHPGRIALVNYLGEHLAPKGNKELGRSRMGKFFLKKYLLNPGRESFFRKFSDSLRALNTQRQKIATHSNTHQLHITEDTLDHNGRFVLGTKTRAGMKTYDPLILDALDREINTMLKDAEHMSWTLRDTGFDAQYDAQVASKLKILLVERSKKLRQISPMSNAPVFVATAGRFSTLDFVGHHINFQKYNDGVNEDHEVLNRDIEMSPFKPKAFSLGRAYRMLIEKKNAFMLLYKQWTRKKDENIQSPFFDWEVLNLKGKTWKKRQSKSAIKETRKPKLIYSKQKIQSSGDKMRTIIIPKR